MITSTLDVEQTAEILKSLIRENTDRPLKDIEMAESRKSGMIIVAVWFVGADFWQEIRFTRSLTKIGWVVECASCGDEQVFDDPIVAREYQEENGVGHCALESCRNEFIRTEKAFAKEDEAWRNET